MNNSPAGRKRHFSAWAVSSVRAWRFRVNSSHDTVVAENISTSVEAASQLYSSPQFIAMRKAANSRIPKPISEERCRRTPTSQNRRSPCAMMTCTKRTTTQTDQLAVAASVTQLKTVALMSANSASSSHHQHRQVVLERLFSQAFATPPRRAERSRRVDRDDDEQQAQQRRRSARHRRIKLRPSLHGPPAPQVGRHHFPRAGRVNQAARKLRRGQSRRSSRASAASGLE